ncbi:MAG: hypothetical protein ACI97B_002011, partial [Verrucomicrobiales bacterium]
LRVPTSGNDAGSVVIPCRRYSSIRAVCHEFTGLKSLLVGSDEP